MTKNTFTLIDFPLALPSPLNTAPKSRLPKRKRGGQPGNHNARTHGFYAAVLTPEQEEEARRITSEEGLDPELANMRVRLHAVILSNPDNPGLSVKPRMTLPGIIAPVWVERINAFLKPSL